jgi:uncharacterized protein
VKIAVKGIQKGPVILRATETPEELGLSYPRILFPFPVELSVKLTAMNEDVLTQADARTQARAECSRCLEEVPLDLAGHFDALYVPKDGPYAKRMNRPNFEWGDQRVNFYSDFTIDLSEEIRNCILLELPMKPLCRPDCAGLCPECGENLNAGPCGCKPDAPDTPWSGLRTIVPPEK